MQTNSKSLAIFGLFAVLWLEAKAHHCCCPHKKTHKKCEETTTSMATSTPTSTSTPTPTPTIEPTSTSTSTTAEPIKINPKCNTGTVSSCQCGVELGSYYYPVPKSGNCKDVFKSTTPDYHFPEEDCSKVQRTVCSLDSRCYDQLIQVGMPSSTPYKFLINYNETEPFCKCSTTSSGYSQLPIPKSGDCTDLDTMDADNWHQDRTCYDEHHICMDTCTCNDLYVEPTKCVPQTCNNVTEPFCKCGIDGDHYPLPESGDCMEILKQLSTPPTHFYRFGSTCMKMRTVCKCKKWLDSEGARCQCDDECLSGCE